jgi:hypothetical protein
MIPCYKLEVEHCVLAWCLSNPQLLYPFAIHSLSFGEHCPNKTFWVTNHLP